jgi:drug/metabolite transporter (DMT)-like permease
VKWGLGYIGNDVLFLWLRFAVASVLTLSIVLAMKRFSMSVMREPAIWMLGALNAAGFIMQYVGLNYTTASNAALLIDINVVAVAIISFFVFRERLSQLQLTGIVLGMIGVFLITTRGSLAFDPAHFKGDMTVFLAGWSWAFFIVLGKSLLTRHSAIEISSGAILSCAVFLTPAVALVASSGADFTIEPLGWVAIIYLGLFCTSIATLLWAMGLEGISATASATIMLLEVLTALAISIGLLEETMKAVAAVGAALVLIAMYLVTARGRCVEEVTVKTT